MFKENNKDSIPENAFDPYEIESSELNLLKNVTAIKSMQLTPDLLDISNLHKSVLDKILLIKKYIKTHELFFEDYVEEFPELFIGNGKYLEKNLCIYEVKFFNILKTNISIYLHYQKIVGNGEIYLQEGLLRTKNKLSPDAKSLLTHTDLLDIYNEFGRSLDVYKSIMIIFLSDFKRNKIKGKVSLNVEVSDIMDPEFLKHYTDLITNYNINIPKGTIILEILENQKIPFDNPEFKSAVDNLKNAGFTFGHDDVIQEKIPLPYVKKLVEKNNEFEVLKIYGKTIQELYNNYKSMGEIMDPTLKLFKNLIEKWKLKGIKVVGEWIETKAHYLFAKIHLGIEYFQGYFIDDLSEEEIRNTI